MKISKIIRLIREAFSLIRFLNTGILLTFMMMSTSTFCIAQDFINLTGQWKIQPAVSPDSLPKPLNWGLTSGSGPVMSWKLDVNCGKNTPWEQVSHESVNCIWYQKTIFIPENWKGNHVVADFRRIEGDGIVFFNNKRVSELLRPGGEVDLTENVLFGKENVLRVFITRDYTGISRDFNNDPLRRITRKSGGRNIPTSQWPMGITGAVTIMSRPPQSVTDVFCISSFRKKELELEVEVYSEHEKSGYHLEAEITDQNSIRVLSLKGSPLNLPEGKSVHTITASWTNPVCWELDKPYLYKARVKLVRDDKVCHQFRDVTFGFRELWTEGNKLFMNGHPSRWRLTDLYGTTKNGLSLYRLIGYNVGQIQPNGNLWWNADTETPLLDEEMIDEMDRLGMGCTVPAPTVSYLRDALLSDSKVRSDYQREAEYHIRHYRNHPSILAWVVSMNSYNPKSNIWPQTMGKRDSLYSSQGRVIDLACSMVKQKDPTRLAFSHADGSEGDVSTANVYLNFVPLQEREDWPKEWAKNGNMPYSAVEFGTPYWNNFWKGNQFLLTEYLSMYLGDRAYIAEGEQGLRQTIEKSLTPGLPTWERIDFKEYPGFWNFQKLFTINTDRAWRTWGVNAGWLNWLLEGYGDPPGEKRRFTNRYKSLPAPLTGTPEWVNPRYHIYKEANKSLISYIAGYPLHTDKTHTFYSGEAIQKQIVTVWDGPGQRVLKAEWKFIRDTRVIQNGTEEIALKAGDIKLLPFKFKAPDVQERKSMKLILQLKDAEQIVTADTLLLDVFPRPVKLKPGIKVVVYDPQNKSVPWIQKLGIKPILWQKGASLKSVGLLIIGREALKQGDSLPYNEADIANGLHVIILEQRPEVWEGMGFQTIETMPRYTYMRDYSSPLLKGLDPHDFINWRGAPDLLPECKPARNYDTEYAPKWTNTHAVASVVLKTPEIVGFTPILQTEFDMAYSPLLEWQYGKGKVTFCSLDLTGRIGEEPVATCIAMNLLTAPLDTRVSDRTVFYSGDLYGAQLLDNLGVKVEKEISLLNAQNSILAIGHGDQSVSAQGITKFIQNGGIVFYLPQTGNDLVSGGYKVTPKELLHASLNGNSALLRGVGPNLLRWRDVLNVDAFSSDDQPTGCSVLCDGIILEKRMGKGKGVYLQVEPRMLADRYLHSPEKAEAVQLSVIRMRQLIAQLLTNLGACPAKATATRLTSVAYGQTYQKLGSWKVLGPYNASTADGKVAIETVFPGQQDAIEGAENPNITYKREDGVVLDWRKVVNSDKDGFIDLSKAFGGKDENAIAYLTKNISSDREQNVVLRFGADYWMEVWLNGESILKVIKNHPKRENGFIVNAPFRKGENILTLKVASGRGGFGFWANMANPSSQGIQKTENMPDTNVKFYSPLYRYFDPYQFAYW